MNEIHEIITRLKSTIMEGEVDLATEITQEALKVGLQV